MKSLFFARNYFEATITDVWLYMKHLFHFYLIFSLDLHVNQA